MGITKSQGQQRLWGFIGLAVSAKFTAIIFIPFLIRRENWKWIFLVIAAAVTPALFFEANPQQMFSSLFKFGAEMRFNDSVHYLLWKVFGSGIAAVICAVILLLLSAGIWLTQDSPLRGAFFCCFAFLFFLGGHYFSPLSSLVLLTLIYMFVFCFALDG